MMTTAWSSGRMVVRRGRMSLSTYERQCVARAKRNAADHALMHIRHMAERFVPVDGMPSDVHVWLFLLPDFTRLFKDWYRQYLDRLLHCYRPDASAMLEDDGTWLTLRYEGARPRALIERAMRCGKYGEVQSLLEQAQRAAWAVKDALRSYEEYAPRTRMQLEPLVATVTEFAAFGLETLFPEALLHERFPKVTLSELSWTPVSAWGKLLDGAMETIERVYVGEAREEEAVEQYAREVSFFRWGDIATHADDRAFTIKLLGGLRRQFPHYGAIWKAEEERRFDARLRGMPIARYEQYVARMRAGVVSEDLACFDMLVRFAREAQQYNEERRIVFTRALRILRTHCERRGLDWRTVELDDVLHPRTNERRYRHVRHLQGSVT